MKGKKLQSAMEYLMTYGWAILIIAVVLGALFALGIFNNPGLPTSCVALSGYLCQSPIYNHATGNLIFTFGQNTGASWAAANIEYASQSASSNVVTCGFTVNAGVGCSIPATNETNMCNGQATGAVCASTSAGLVSGQTLSLSVPATLPASTKLGQTIQGQIWVQFQTSLGGTYQYVQVATVNLKAT